MITNVLWENIPTKIDKKYALKLSSVRIAKKAWISKEGRKYLPPVPLPLRFS